MRKFIDLSSQKNAQYISVIFTLIGLSGGQAYGDSTYFPEGIGTVEETAGTTAADNSAAIKAWTELPPLKTKTTAKNEKNVNFSGRQVVRSNKSQVLKSARPPSQKPTQTGVKNALKRAQATPVSYGNVAMDRPPLAILDHDQEVYNQKWYIYSAAIRGLKDPAHRLQVLMMEGCPSNRGEDIKKLLVDMGVEPEKIQLIRGTGEEDQKGLTYIFGGS